MHHLLGVERVLEHVVGAAKAASISPRRRWIVERDVGVALAVEMLEVGERAGRLQLVVHDGVAT